MGCKKKGGKRESLENKESKKKDKGCSCCCDSSNFETKEELNSLVHSH